MADIFLSYKREDRDRAAVIVEALREAGTSVWWDQDIPAGAPWRHTIVHHLDEATLCVVAWSEHSSIEGPGSRYVIEEAERAAGRGAYLGIRLDPVMPPFGFTEQQAFDLSRWRGKADDPDLAVFVAYVRARLEGKAAPLPPRGTGRRAARPNRTGLYAALGLGLVAVAAILAFLLWPRPPAQTPTAFVNARLAQFPCTWAQISNVTSGDGGERVRLSGLSAMPGSLPTELLRAASTAAVPLAGVDVTDVVAAPAAICAQLQVIQPWRDPEASRLTIIPHPGPPVRTEHGFRGQLEFEIEMANLPPHAALLGLDSRDGLYVLAPDMAAYRASNPPLRTSGTRVAYSSFYFTENADVQNVGLLLLTSTRPIDPALVESIGRAGDPAALQRVEAAARDGQWRFELGLVRCGFGAPADRRC